MASTAVIPGDVRTINELYGGTSVLPASDAQLLVLPENASMRVLKGERQVLVPSGAGGGVGSADPGGGTVALPGNKRVATAIGGAGKVADMPPSMTRSCLFRTPLGMKVPIGAAGAPAAGPP